MHRRDRLKQQVDTAIHQATSRPPIKTSATVNPPAHEDPSISAPRASTHHNPRPHPPPSSDTGRNNVVANAPAITDDMFLVVGIAATRGDRVVVNVSRSRQRQRQARINFRPRGRFE